ncbi:hypothetical protein AB0N09_40350 [Streptomyces erythrochromogenes]|uniref:hypothetical protein n=1 Tax=Streptomyces erythrochromogenes TaxID=285574 RepID=UPI003439D667
MHATHIANRRHDMAKALAFLFVTIWAVSGCAFLDSPPLPEARNVTKEQLVGTWRDDTSGSLTLSDNGTFTAEKLHTSFHEGGGVKVLGEELIEGTGTWTFGEFHSGPEVNVSFTGGGNSTLWVVEKDKANVLSAWIGDGDRALLEKTPSPTP